MRSSLLAARSGHYLNAKYAAETAMWKEYAKQVEGTQDEELMAEDPEFKADMECQNRAAEEEEVARERQSHRQRSEAASTVASAGCSDRAGGTPSGHTGSSW